jgi:hypothetical protein
LAGVFGAVRIAAGESAEALSGGSVKAELFLLASGVEVALAE